MQALTEQVARELGPRARILAAEKVTVGGIRGFFAKRHYEVVVEVPDEPVRRGAHATLDLPARIGIAALLDDADEHEARLHSPPPPQVSTESDAFARLMDELTFQAAPAGARPFVPGLFTGAGDLVLVLGLLEDPIRVARGMALAAGYAEITVGGALESHEERADDRRGALAARARGVRRGEPVFLAYGLGHGRDLEKHLTALPGLRPDQTWLAVDAGRKADDTARWVHQVARVIPVDALAVEGREATSTPASVEELGFRVGWVDGRPASGLAL